jgi:hypothetical protein
MGGNGANPTMQAGIDWLKAVAGGEAPSGEPGSTSSLTYEQLQAAHVAATDTAWTTGVDGANQDGIIAPPNGYNWPNDIPSGAAIDSVLQDIAARPYDFFWLPIDNSPVVLIGDWNHNGVIDGSSEHGIAIRENAIDRVLTDINGGTHPSIYGAQHWCLTARR